VIVLLQVFEEEEVEDVQKEDELKEVEDVQKEEEAKEVEETNPRRGLSPRKGTYATLVRSKHSSMNRFVHSSLQEP
jgi:hypothetical protein